MHSGLVGPDILSESELNGLLRILLKRKAELPFSLESSFVYNI